VVAAVTRVYTPDLEFAPQLKNLRIFLAVAEAGSIARAADTLLIAPSAITRSINELEKILGVPVFERKPRGMLLTTYGRAVLARAERIDCEINAAIDELSASRSANAQISRHAMRMLMFSDRKLELVIHLAAMRNISLSAAELGLTQAGISMALSRIEGVIGRQMFQRRIEGVTPTEETDRLVLHARRIFAEMRYLASDISAISGDLAGSGVVGTTPLGRRKDIVAAIVHISEANPRLRISTAEYPYERLIAGLRSTEIDMVLGVLRPRGIDYGLTTEKLFTDSFSMFVRAGHPLAGKPNLQPSDLVGMRWIFPRLNSLSRPLIEGAFRSLGIDQPEPAFESGDMVMIRQLLLPGDMIAITSPNQLRFELDCGAIVELPLELRQTERDIGLIVREGAMHSPAAQAVLDGIRSLTATDAAHGSSHG